MCRPDHHNEIEINFLTSGYLTYLLGGQKVVIEAGQLSLFWAAIPHQIVDYSNESAYFVVTIPLHTFLEWRLPECFVQALMQGKLVSDTSSLRSQSDIPLFEQWLSDLSKPNAGITQPVLLELQARLVRLALEFNPQRNVFVVRKHLSRLPNVGLSKVEQMACFIARNYTQKLTVQQICDVANLNSNYAMTLFQKTFGSTLVSFLTQHRIAHAQRLLTTSEMSITEIAFNSGFSSISRFNEAFLEVSHCSPREYRKVHIGLGRD